MKSFHLHIITPKRTVYSDEVHQITLPTATGQISILADHIALLSQLEPGEMILKKESKIEHLVCSGGFIQVKGNTVTVLADSVEFSYEIEIETVHQALKEAKDSLSEYKKDQEEYLALSKKIKEYEASLKVSEKAKK